MVGSGQEAETVNNCDERQGVVSSEYSCTPFEQHAQAENEKNAYAKGKRDAYFEARYSCGYF